MKKEEKIKLMKDTLNKFLNEYNLLNQNDVDDIKQKINNNDLKYVSEYLSLIVYEKKLSYLTKKKIDSIRNKINKIYD
jgi:Fe-S cluster assembly iron-binding protein IscA